MALRAWKPSDAVGVTVREFDPSIAANIDVSGGLVTAFRSSDGSLTATAINSNERPTYLAQGFTGGPTIKFFNGGQGNRLATQAFAQGPYWSNFAVAKQVENTGTQCVIDADNFSQGTGKRVAQSIRYDSQNVQSIAFTPAVDVAQASINQGTNLAAKILASSLPSRTVQISVDGGTPATATLPNDPIAASALLALGGWLGNGQYFRGELAIAYNVQGVLSSADHDRFVGYLAWRFNLVGNLPSSHPYKSAAPQIDDGSGGGATDYPVSATDSGTLADTATARAAVALAATDTGALVDTVSVAVNAVVSLSDTLAATEAATARAAVAVSTSDTATLTDGSASSSASSGSTSDLLVPTEAIGLSVAAVATASDVLVASEGAPGVSAAAVASTADAAPLGDTATATAASPGTGGLSDTAALTDAASARAAVSVAASDALTATDTATAVAAVVLAASDALVAVDGAAVAVNMVVGTSDALALTEGQPATANARTGTADAGVLSDVHSMSVNATAVLVDSWTYSETIRYDVILPVGNLLADVASLNDAATVRVGVSFGSGDVLVPREAFTVRVGVAFGVSDLLVVSDVCSFTVGFWYDVTGGGFPESPWKEL